MAYPVLVIKGIALRPARGGSQPVTSFGQQCAVKKAWHAKEGCSAIHHLDQPSVTIEHLFEAHHGTEFPMSRVPPAVICLRHAFGLHRGRTHYSGLVHALAAAH